MQVRRVWGGRGNEKIQSDQIKTAAVRMNRGGCSTLEKTKLRRR
jgi:hypothetical protein